MWNLPLSEGHAAILSGSPYSDDPRRETHAEAQRRGGCCSLTVDPAVLCASAPPREVFRSAGNCVAPSGLRIAWRTRNPGLRYAGPGLWQVAPWEQADLPLARGSDRMHPLEQAMRPAVERADNRAVPYCTASGIGTSPSGGCIRRRARRGDLALDHSLVSVSKTSGDS